MRLVRRARGGGLSPSADGSGSWQGRLPQELRLLARITGVGEANRPLEHYIGEMNRKFSAPAAQSGHAFIHCTATNLNQIFSVQQGRTVAQDKTVRLGARTWQIERTCWRGTLAGCLVTICEHLHGHVTMLDGPYVVGRGAASGEDLEKSERERAPPRSPLRYLY